MDIFAATARTFVSLSRTQSNWWLPLLSLIRVWHCCRWCVGDRKAWSNCRLLARSSTVIWQMSLVSHFLGIMTSWLVIIWRHTWRHRRGMIVTSLSHSDRLPSYHRHLAYFCRRTWPPAWCRGHARSRRGHEAWRHRSRATAPTVGKLTCSVWWIVAAFIAVTWPAAAKSTARLHTWKLTYGDIAAQL